MSDTVISVENLSKQYRLGKVGRKTLHDDFNRWLYRLLGKEDPYLKIGEENVRSVKGSSEYVWALRNINFEVKRGEILGVIGSNGAGKSTLLKILSKVTAPTTGSVKVKGRVASLLEVGTGFHPELSGRDNIYLNGAILGMTKKEIASKFDAIVDFAGVERYIDTPVKRYSSGMYVRLAFAVAAHLEPEILIVDEVLAVGDAEFQKKCLGKMKDVSEQDGRTVLFVSHNLAAIKQICDEGILMNFGKLELKSCITTVLEKYQQEEVEEEEENVRVIGKQDSKRSFFSKLDLIQNDEKRGNWNVSSGESFTMSFEFVSKKTLSKVELGLVIRDASEIIIYSTNSRDFGKGFIQLKPDTYNFNFEINLPIKSGKYKVDITLISEGSLIDQWIPNKKIFVLNNYNSALPDKWLGILTTESEFKYEKLH